MNEGEPGIIDQETYIHERVGLNIHIQHEPEKPAMSGEVTEGKPTKYWLKLCKRMAEAGETGESSTAASKAPEAEESDKLAAVEEESVAPADPAADDGGKGKMKASVS